MIKSHVYIQYKGCITDLVKHMLWILQVEFTTGETNRVTSHDQATDLSSVWSIYLSDWSSMLYSRILVHCS